MPTREEVLRMRDQAEVKCDAGGRRQECNLLQQVMIVTSVPVRFLFDVPYKFLVCQKPHYFVLI